MKVIKELIEYRADDGFCFRRDDRCCRVLGVFRYKAPLCGGNVNK